MAKVKTVKDKAKQKLEELIDEAQENESYWFEEGIRLREVYKKKYKEEI